MVENRNNAVFLVLLEQRKSTRESIQEKWFGFGEDQFFSSVSLLLFCYVFQVWVCAGTDARVRIRTKKAFHMGSENFVIMPAPWKALHTETVCGRSG